MQHVLEDERCNPDTTYEEESLLSLDSLFEEDPDEVTFVPPPRPQSTYVPTRGILYIIGITSKKDIKFHLFDCFDPSEELPVIALIEPTHSSPQKKHVSLFPVVKEDYEYKLAKELGPLSTEIGEYLLLMWCGLAHQHSTIEYGNMWGDIKGGDIPYRKYWTKSTPLDLSTMQEIRKKIIETNGNSEFHITHMTTKGRNQHNIIYIVNLYRKSVREVGSFREPHRLIIGTNFSDYVTKPRPHACVW